MLKRSNAARVNLLIRFHVGSADCVFYRPLTDPRSWAYLRSYGGLEMRVFPVIVLALIVVVSACLARERQKGFRARRCAWTAGETIATGSR